MNFYQLERKFGKYVIPRLSLCIIVAYVFGYILQFTASAAMGFLFLDPYKILHGQVWRIVTWIFIPPSDFGIFTLINLYFFYFIGSTLEKLWGDFRYNLYIFIGLISVIIGCFALYFVGTATGLMGARELGQQVFSQYISFYVSTYYINVTVIMAFAMTIPEMGIRFMFVIPLKMKHLAYMEMAFLLLDFVTCKGIVPRAVMIISLLNFIWFYISSKKIGSSAKKYGYSAPKTNKRKFTVIKGNKGENSSVTRHKCAVCMRTEVTNPELTFRFCSKCNGNFEYCEDHLYTHTHIE